jgi:hypothetical protein
VDKPLDATTEAPSKAEAEEAKEQAPKLSAQLIALVRTLGVHIFVTSRNEVYATLPHGRNETLKVRSKLFAEWLQGQAFEQLGKPVGQSSLDEAQGTLSGMARASGDAAIDVHNRIIR